MIYLRQNQILFVVSALLGATNTLTVKSEPMRLVTSVGCG